MPLTQKQKDEYLKKADTCPFCKEDDLIGDSVEVAGDTATQMVSCSDCGAAWVDNYTLTDITVTDEPEED